MVVLLALLMMGGSTESDYGSRESGMYKWQRNRDRVKQKAAEAKAARLGTPVEAVLADAEDVVLAEHDPRTPGNIESDYGMRSGQYAWQRNKDEIKRKAEEAKAKRSKPAADPGPEEEETVALDTEGAISVPLSWLKFKEPRQWYKEPRLCEHQDQRQLDCKHAAVGMAVRALEARDLKPYELEQLKQEDPAAIPFMEQMVGRPGTIVKLQRKTSALVKFVEPVNDGQMSPGKLAAASFELRRKVKLTEKISPSSRKVAELEKGSVVVVLERKNYDGEERLRCHEGWLSARSAKGKKNLRPAPAAREEL